MLHFLKKNHKAIVGFISAAIGILAYIHNPLIANLMAMLPAADQAIITNIVGFVGVVLGAVLNLLNEAPFE